MKSTTVLTLNYIYTFFQTHEYNYGTIILLCEYIIILQEKPQQFY